MFSKAKRFDYYPKPEATSPGCTRCLKHHTDTMCKSMRKRSYSLPKTPKRKPLPYSTATFTRSQSTTSSCTSGSKSSYGEDNIYSEVCDSAIELTPPSTPDDFSQYIDSMERKIASQREKIENMRDKMFPTSSGTYNVRRTPSDVKERVKHLENISRFCVKETLDFIVLYNKNQEEKCAVRPDEYKHLVDFCSELIKDVSVKLKREKEETKWKKIKNFFGGFLKPFRTSSDV